MATPPPPSSGIESLGDVEPQGAIYAPVPVQQSASTGEQAVVPISVVSAPTWQSLAWSLVIIVGVVCAALIVHRVLWKLFERLVQGRGVVLESIIKHTRRPVGLLLPLIGLQVVLPGLNLGAVGEPLRHAIAITLILSLGWLATCATRVIDDVVAARYRIDIADNLASRRIQTQVKIARQVLCVLIWIIAGASALMTFPRAGQLGTSLLASAGIAGIVIGMAAKPTLSNLLAGMQIAVTQPIRIDDVVVIHGEWGKIEEITTTYVVVRIWDERRLIVPLNDFIENRFENWTRTTSQVLGTAMIYVDFETPVHEIRAELERIVKRSTQWDGRVCVLQVTGTSPNGMELRALVSAARADLAFELRCFVRENLVTYIRDQYPGALAKQRVELRRMERLMGGNGDVGESPVMGDGLASRA
jgi:small-conductance mechanosensitive channel